MERDFGEFLDLREDVFNFIHDNPTHPDTEEATELNTTMIDFLGTEQEYDDTRFEEIKGELIRKAHRLLTKVK